MSTPEFPNIARTDDVFLVDALLTDDEREWQQKARAFAQTKIAPTAEADFDAKYFRTELIPEIAKQGFFGMHIKGYGCAGASPVAYGLVCLELVAVDSGWRTLVSVQGSLAMAAISKYGSEEQKQEWLPQMAAGDKIGCFGLTEPQGGSDPANMLTVATRDGDGWVINGSKKWISNAGESEFYTVIAQTDPSLGSKGITAFVLEKSDSGVSFGAPEKKMGFRGSPTREVYFDNVEISDDRRISDVGKGFALAMDTLDHTRITIAAQALGLAQGAFDVAKKYSHERKQFGKEIFDFQAIQFMLADMAIAIEAARQLTYAAAAKSERGDKDLRFFSAASKTYATDVAMQVTTDAVQILGGYGYVSDYPVERMMRDAKLTQIYEGTNQIQRIVIARNLP